MGVPSEEARRLQQSSTRDAAAKHIIRRAVVLSGATGFTCGLPGYLATPITVPSNVTGVLLIQFHMCASIAALSGKDPLDSDVRERAIQCVMDDVDPDETNREGDATASDTEQKNGAEEDEADSSDREIFGLIGRVASKLGERGVRFAGEQAMRWTYKKARSRASRGLPFLGGVIGAVTDSMDTQAVGSRARLVFQPELASKDQGQ
jgi:hypothetical protein